MLGKDTAVLVRLCHAFRFTMRQMFSADGSFGMQASKFSTWTLQSVDDTVMSGSVPDRITSVFTEVPPEGSEITDAQQWLSSLFLAQRILQLPRICRYYYIAQMMRSSKSLQFYSEEERSAVLNLCLSKMLLLYSVCYFSRALLRRVAAAVVRTDWSFSDSVTFSVWSFLFNCQSNLDLKNHHFINILHNIQTLWEAGCNFTTHSFWLCV